MIISADLNDDGKEFQLFEPLHVVRVVRRTLPDGPRDSCHQLLEQFNKTRIFFNQVLIFLNFEYTGHNHLIVTYIFQFQSERLKPKSIFLLLIPEISFFSVILQYFEFYKIKCRLNYHPGDQNKTKIQPMRINNTSYKINFLEGNC